MVETFILKIKGCGHSFCLDDDNLKIRKYFHRSPNSHKSWKKKPTVYGP